MSRSTEDRIARRKANVTPSGVTSVVAKRDDDDERIGSVVDGRYRLDALVGRGGMGVVYRAEHVAIRRTVALKLLHGSLAGVPELRSRFEREALAIGKIEHPNCVNVSDFGSLADGSLFLVMEFLEGRSLGEILEREHHLRPRRALRILRHVLTGLAHAHEMGIVHRDIKPDNVFVSGDDETAKILDFGIAKVVHGGGEEEDVKLTQAGVAFGTPVYMSPEQALGNPVDGRADLYAASVMAFEMLTGRPPFYSDDKLEVMSMHTTREPPSMQSVLDDAGYPGASVPRAVEELVRRGLAKRPIDRWANAAAYVAALDEVQLDLALDAAPDATPGPEVDLPEPRTHTGHTGEHPLVTTTGSSLIRAPGSIPPATAAAADSMRSMPVALVNRKTPSRARRALPRKAILIFAAGAGVGVALLIALVLGGGGGSGDDDDRPARSSIASKAAAFLKSGDFASAIKLLEAQKNKITNDPSAQLELGHAYGAKSDMAHAIEAYQRAVALDPGNGADVRLRGDLRAMMENRSEPATARDAFDLSIATLHDETAGARLVSLASGKDRAMRVMAEKEARKVGLASRVDWFDAYALDLDQGELCIDRKEAVAGLHAIGDARAIPLLEAAVAKRAGGKHGKLVNSCLLAEAQETLIYLRSLPGAH